MFQSYASSSGGNAYLVTDGVTKILLECGISFKKLQALTGFSLHELDACLISHEHKDHCKCVYKMISSGIPTYLSQGTARSLGLSEAILDMALEMEKGKQFRVGTVEIVPFATFHDAQEPLGFLLKSMRDGDILAFATDTVSLPYRFPGVTILAVEANFDHGRLWYCEKLPEKTKRRIENTHMEIGRLCEELGRMDLSRCREIYLLHLSSSSSCVYEFEDMVRRRVPPAVRVTACPKGG